MSLFGGRRRSGSVPKAEEQRTDDEFTECWVDQTDAAGKSFTLHVWDPPQAGLRRSTDRCRCGRKMYDPDLATAEARADAAEARAKEAAETLRDAARHFEALAAEDPILRPAYAEAATYFSTLALDTADSRVGHPDSGSVGGPGG